MEPEGRSLRELGWMALGRRRAEWDRAAALLAQQANLHRGKDDPEVHPDECNPYAPEHRKRRPAFAVDGQAASDFFGVLARHLGAKKAESIPGRRVPAPKIPGWNVPKEDERN